MEKDLEHLKLLSIFHYVVGGLACCCGLLWTLYMLSGGILIIAAASMTGRDRMGAFIGGAVALLVGTFLLALFETCGILCIVAGRKYGQQQGYWFCFSLAIFLCLNFPLGTALGVFAIIVLNRPSVKALFRGPPITGIPTPPVS